jgi:hypothetical protein
MISESVSRVLQQNSDNKPSKTVAYIFMAIIFLGLIYFVYNWWRCRQSRVIDQELEDYNHNYNDDEQNFKPTKRADKQKL